MAAPRPERNPNLGPRLTLSNYRFVPGDLEAAILGGGLVRGLPTREVISGFAVFFSFEVV